MKETIALIVERIRRERPLVHNITNYVVMNYTANALLAFGASPVMAHAMEEVEEMASLSRALVVNIGTLSTPWVEAMISAARAANASGVPVILDPVGVGATRFRTSTAGRILGEARVDVIRGNASEILALRDGRGSTRGVDSLHTTEEARAAAIALAQELGNVVAVTGERDFVTDGSRTAVISNGHWLMSRVTGTGCTASALAGAFCAVEKDHFLAAAGSLVTFGLAGQLASKESPGPGTFQVRLLDALHQVDGTAITAWGKVTTSTVDTSRPTD